MHQHFKIPTSVCFTLAYQPPKRKKTRPSCFVTKLARVAREEIDGRILTMGFCEDERGFRRTWALEFRVWFKILAEGLDGDLGFFGRFSGLI